MLYPFSLLRRTNLVRTLVPLALLTSIGVASAQNLPVLKVDRVAPYNLFLPGQPIHFVVQATRLPPTLTTSRVVVQDLDGRVVVNKDLALQSGQPMPLDLGALPRGYYTLRLWAPGLDESLTSFGVMEQVQRSAAEARQANSVFGVKWWGGVGHQREGAAALSRLGLQWTRIITNQTGDLTTRQLLTEFPMNAVVKIERFPAELYDADKYGPLEDWEKKYGRGSWTLKTLPKKEPYQALLRQQLKENIPPDQLVFEVWNEPWDKMAPDQFAILSNWISEVILQERPGAVVGPNLAGSTSDFEYDARFIKAGGMKGMKMVALHPYGMATDRAWLRDYRAWLKRQTGVDQQIYITEYGSHSTPAGPSVRSEREQARRIVLQSLSLYAEGVRALIPHWLGQSEKDPTYVEDWFGFVRQNEQPKPALLAHANCARLIDGSKYLGDLWLGPAVGAMLFQNSGANVLALWGGNESGAPLAEPLNQEVTLRTSARQLTLVDMEGGERSIEVHNGEARVPLSNAPQYLLGLGAETAALASKELRPDRWPRPARPTRLTRPLHFLKTPPAFDGNLAGWAGLAQIGVANPKVAGSDGSGEASLGWDAQFLYIGLNMRDNEMLNKRPRGKAYQQDSLELFVSAAPRETGSGYGPADHQFILTPTSADGPALLGEVTDREAGVVTDIPGGRIFAVATQKGDHGWVLQAAIPWTALGAFQPRPGAKLALELRVNDADTSHERFKLDPVDLTAPLNVLDPSTWSLLEVTP